MREYDAKIVGFALRSCKVCYGTGKLGWIGPQERGVVQVCPCVVSFEADVLRKEADDALEAKQRDRSTVKA